MCSSERQPPTTIRRRPFVFPSDIASNLLSLLDSAAPAHCWAVFAQTIFRHRNNSHLKSHLFSITESSQRKPHNSGYQRHRPRPSKSAPLCKFWKQGRCTRNPCRFTHKNSRTWRRPPLHPRPPTSQPSNSKLSQQPQCHSTLPPSPAPPSPPPPPPPPTSAIPTPPPSAIPPHPSPSFFPPSPLLPHTITHLTPPQPPSPIAAPQTSVPPPSPPFFPPPTNPHSPAACANTGSSTRLLTSQRRNSALHTCSLPPLLPTPTQRSSANNIIIPDLNFYPPHASADNTIPHRTTAPSASDPNRRLEDSVTFGISLGSSPVFNSHIPLSLRQRRRALSKKLQKT